MKLHHLLLSVVILFSGTLCVNAKPLTINEALEGACRVSVSTGLGSGTCIDKENGQYIFLTNGHVVERFQSAYIELFRDGYKSYKIPAKVIKTFWEENTDKDFSLLSVDEKYVYKYPPRIIPLVPVGTIIPLGYTYSMGCPEGKWLCGWEGTIEKKEGSRLIFTPPPVGGQSGSSLLVNLPDKNGELHTYVGGLITFRVSDDATLSDRRDVNGFEIAKGAAVDIATIYKVLGYQKEQFIPTYLPSNYTTTASEICDVCGRTAIDHAMGNNNKYYCVYISDGHLTCQAGPNVQIIRWPARERIIPRPDNANPNVPDNGNPFGNQLPDISPPIPGGSNDESPTPTPEQDCQEKIDKLNQDLQLLQSQLELKAKELIEQQSQIDNLTVKLNEANANSVLAQNLKEQLGSLESQYIAIQEELATKASEVANKEELIESLNTHVAIISNDLISATESQKSLVTEVQVAKKETEEVTGQRTIWTWLSGLLGSGLIATLIWKYWDKRGRSKANTIVDKWQNTADEYLTDKYHLDEDVVDHLHDMVDNVQDTINQTIDDVLKQKLPSIVESLVEKKTNDIVVNRPVTTPVPSVTSVVDKVNPEVVETVSIKSSDNPTEGVAKTTSRRYNRKKRRFNNQTNASQLNPSSVNLNITNTNSNTDYNDSYIREFFNHKIKCGENISDWALIGIIYKEAIDELEKGKLYYKGKTRLLGQAKTAECIKDWVRNEFYNRMKQKDVLNQDSLYQEAMLGFLYKEAVDELAKGTFNVLGHAETAKTIRNWVNKQFLKRVNISI